ncbi:MAG: hypothetical protein Q4D17_02630 [Planctomycetia bacterium]|nr:hypothetical protein [Planctomycetia bacterium]
MSEVIAVRCHACRVGMKIKSEYAGKLRKCPKCGTIFEVPLQDGETKAPSPEILAELKRQAVLKRQAEQNAAARTANSTGFQEAASNAPSAEASSTPAISHGFPGTSETAISSPASQTFPSLNAEDTIHPIERPKRLEPQFRYLILDQERLLAVWQMENGWQVNDGSRLISAKRNAQILPKQGDFRFLELQLGTVDEEFRITKMRIFQLARQYSVSKIALDENEVLSTIIGAASLTRSQKSTLLQGLKKYFMRSVWADSPAIYDFLLNDDFHSSEIG